MYYSGTKLIPLHRISSAYRMLGNKKTISRRREDAINPRLRKHPKGGSDGTTMETEIIGWSMLGKRLSGAVLGIGLVRERLTFR